MHINLDDGKTIRVISLGPDDPIVGMISGAGPQVTLRPTDADPLDQSAHLTLDTLLVDHVGKQDETVALIVTDRMLHSFSGIIEKSFGMTVRMSAETRITTRGFRVSQYKMTLE